jgi:hypothetical protein
MEQNLEILVRAVLASFANHGKRTLSNITMENWLKHRTGEKVMAKEQLICMHISTKVYNMNQANWVDILGPFVFDVLVAINKDLEKDL